MIGKKHTALWERQKRIKEKGGKCRKCGETKHITVEHIIPVNWILQFALPMGEKVAAQEWEENLEDLCIYCNRTKGGTIDPRNPNTYKLLRQLIDRAEAFHESHFQDS